MGEIAYKGHWIRTRRVDVWVAIIERIDHPVVLQGPDVTATLDEGEEICLVRARRRVDDEIGKAGRAGSNEKERRQYRRFKVVWAGGILTNPPTECIVLDISAQGLKLRLPAESALPRRFVISIPERGEFAAEPVNMVERIVRVRLLADKQVVAKAFADAVPLARLLEELPAH